MTSVRRAIILLLTKCFYCFGFMEVLYFLLNFVFLLVLCFSSFCFIELHFLINGFICWLVLVIDVVSWLYGKVFEFLWLWRFSCLEQWLVLLPSYVTLMFWAWTWKVHLLLFVKCQKWIICRYIERKFHHA